MLCGRRGGGSDLTIPSAWHDRRSRRDAGSSPRCIGHNRGEVWPRRGIAKRRAAIEAAGLTFDVVESIGVGEEIKTRSGAWRGSIDNYKQSLRNAARAGVKGVLLQFHGDHRLDAHRPDVAAPARRLRAAFRRRRLRRLRPVPARARRRREGLCPRAHRRARARLETLSPDKRDELERTLIDWLPAARLHLRPRELPRGAEAVIATLASRICAPTYRLRARDRRGRRGGRRAARHPSRRSLVPDLRPAARDVERRRRAPAVRGRALPRLRPHVLRRLLRLERGQRPARHARRIRRRACISRICAASSASRTARSTRPSISKATAT